MFGQFLRTISKKLFRQAATGCARRRPIQRRLEVEALESRQLMAAGLSASLTKGVLTIQTTPAADQIVLRQSNQRIAVAGLPSSYGVQKVKRIVVEGFENGDAVKVKSGRGVQKITAPVFVHWSNGMLQRRSPIGVWRTLVSPVKPSDPIGQGPIDPIPPVEVPLNSAPALAAIPDQETKRGAEMTIALSATDANGDPITFSARFVSGSDLDLSAVVMGIAGSQLTIQPNGVVGTFTVEVIASDGLATSVRTFNVAVTNAAPVLEAIVNKQVTDGEILTVSIWATDPDGDTVNYSARALNEYGEPTNAVSLNMSGNQLTIDSSGYVGTFRVEVTASDGVAASMSTFAVAIEAKAAAYRWIFSEQTGRLTAVKDSVAVFAVENVKSFLISPDGLVAFVVHKSGQLCRYVASEGGKYRELHREINSFAMATDGTCYVLDADGRLHLYRRPQSSGQAPATVVDFHLETNAGYRIRSFAVLADGSAFVLGRDGLLHHATVVRKTIPDISGDVRIVIVIQLKPLYSGIEAFTWNDATQTTMMLDSAGNLMRYRDQSLGTGDLVAERVAHYQLMQDGQSVFFLLSNGELHESTLSEPMSTPLLDSSVRSIGVFDGRLHRLTHAGTVARWENNAWLVISGSHSIRSMVVDDAGQNFYLLTDSGAIYCVIPRATVPNNLSLTMHGVRDLGLDVGNRLHVLLHNGEYRRHHGSQIVLSSSVFDSNPSYDVVANQVRSIGIVDRGTEVWWLSYDGALSRGDELMLDLVRDFVVAGGAVFAQQAVVAQEYTTLQRWTNPGWEQIRDDLTPSFDELAVSPIDGSVWVLDTLGKLYRDGQLMREGVEQFQFGPRGDLYVGGYDNGRGGMYRYHAGTWQNVLMEVQKFAVAPDGTLYAQTWSGWFGRQCIDLDQHGTGWQELANQTLNFLMTTDGVVYVLRRDGSLGSYDQYGWQEQCTDVYDFQLDPSGLLYVHRGDGWFGALNTLGEWSHLADDVAVFTVDSQGLLTVERRTDVSPGGTTLNPTGGTRGIMNAAGDASHQEFFDAVGAIGQQGYEPHGSGTLLINRGGWYVLTAAHVVEDKSNLIFQLSDLTSRFVSDIAFHPDLDLAVLKLDRPITHVKPASLPSSLLHGLSALGSGFRAAIAGFGRTGSGEGGDYEPNGQHKYWGYANFEQINLEEHRLVNKFERGESGIAPGDSGGAVLIATRARPVSGPDAGQIVHRPVIIGVHEGSNRVNPDGSNATKEEILASGPLYGDMQYHVAITPAVEHWIKEKIYGPDDGSPLWGSL